MRLSMGCDSRGRGYARNVELRAPKSGYVSFGAARRMTIRCGWVHRHTLGEPMYFTFVRSGCRERDTTVWASLIRDRTDRSYCAIVGALRTGHVASASDGLGHAFMSTLQPDAGRLRRRLCVGEQPLENEASCLPRRGRRWAGRTTTGFGSRVTLTQEGRRIFRPTSSHPPDELLVRHERTGDEQPRAISAPAGRRGRG